MGEIPAQPASSDGEDSPLLPFCSPTPSQQAADLLSGVRLDEYTQWIRQLSGADPVTLDGASQPVRLLTRYSPTLFDTRPSAYDYVLQQLRAWYPDPGWIEEDPYQPYLTQLTWSNIILTIPGSQHPEEVVILSAHLDSTTRTTPASLAPGADDNATGAAALLEAARVMQNQALPRTLRLIWFTGEEQGLRGSGRYLGDPDHPERRQGIIGVINLDMFGYDGDGDRCFELHVSLRPDTGAAPASRIVASCVTRAIVTHNLGLTYDFITSGATLASDHASFWVYDIGAVEILENYSTHDLPGGCVGADGSPYYHTDQDTIDHVNLTYAFDITRAALAAAFSLADAAVAVQRYVPVMFGN